MMQEMRSDPFVHFAIFGEVDHSDIYTIVRHFLKQFPILGHVMQKYLVLNALQNVPTSKRTDFEMDCIQSLKPLQKMSQVQMDLVVQGTYCIKKIILPTL